MEKLVLASASPRRRELLGEMGIEFDVMPSEVDERQIVADHPRTFAIRAAYAKARDVASRLEDGRWVLAADTVVTRQMVLYGKPESAGEAFRMLRTLSGESHHVITGIALAQAGSMKTFLRAADTRVVFRPLTDTEIGDYIATGEPMDKAGSYGIQGHGGALVDHIEGDYYNVVGLPCEALIELMEEAGIDATPRALAQPVRWRK